jgi:hypothetical protein
MRVDYLQDKVTQFNHLIAEQQISVKRIFDQNISNTVDIKSLQHVKVDKGDFEINKADH